MPVLPNGQMLPYGQTQYVGSTGFEGPPQMWSDVLKGGGVLSTKNPQLFGMQQQPRFNRPQGAGPAPGTAQPQTPQQVDPRLQMWIQQQMQRRQAGNMPRFTQPMTMQDRMGMMGPGLASIRAGAQQGPMRQGTAPGVSGMMAAPAGGINMNDLVQRRGILPIG